MFWMTDGSVVEMMTRHRLGDWYPDDNKYPDGLHPIVDYVIDEKGYGIRPVGRARNGQPG